MIAVAGSQVHVLSSNLIVAIAKELNNITDKEIELC